MLVRVLGTVHAKPVKEVKEVKEVATKQHDHPILE